MLHVVNGDATVARLAPAALPGEVLVWRDILVEGPVDPETEIARLAERRAPWLARRLGITANEYVDNGRAQAAGLAAALAHDEIVLWFEQDLFCVANLAHVAAWLERARPEARVSLVFPAEPLGRTPSGELAVLFAARTPFAPRDIARAAAWWRAYGSPTPTAHVANGSTASPARVNDGDNALSFLAQAWWLHLARFPSVATGLGSVDSAALNALGDEWRPFADLFRAVSVDARIRGHGMSDLQLAAALHALAGDQPPRAGTAAPRADAPAPLVRIRSTEETVSLSANTIGTWEISLTDAGRAVWEGRRDRLDAQPIDWWLGGVRLEGHDVRWRWDERSQSLVEGSGRTWR